MTLKGVYFISGINTDVGKSIVTGYLAKKWMNEGINLITQKFIQTGCDSISEDIITHRKIMGIDILDIDKDMTTCPIVFTYPSSPHLAAEIDKREIDFELIKKSTQKLRSMYDLVLIEGAGGLHVPLKDLYTTIDYIQENKLPLILVTSPVLGSINHTLLSLEVCLNRGIEVAAIVYNKYPDAGEYITADTLNYLKMYRDKYIPNCEIIEIPKIQI